ncbi:MAG: sulfur carrier protein ThiS [Phycisphaerales bacterium]|nr:MAG: sulfur carrier protein ThiS [Phycisphaerales bacterium]
MQVWLNGQERTLDENISLGALLDELGLAPQRVAVEVNRDLVRRAEYPTTALHEGDRIEIVTLVGGG